MSFVPQPFNWELADSGLSSVMIWFEIEWLVFIGTVLSNMLFLALRTCMRHKIQLDQVPERKQLPGVDTIIAIQEVANAFNAQYVPMIVSMFLFFQPNNTNTGTLYWQLTFIAATQLVSCFCITFLIFVHWKKGPDWYLKYSHKVFFILLLLNYLILPGLNVAFFLFYIIWPGINLKQQSIESYIIFVSIVCLMRIFEFVTLIRRSVLLDAKIFLETAKNVHEQSAEALKEELLKASEDEQNMSNERRATINMTKEILGEKVPYLKRVRGYG
jgi:hypothetical protein